MPGHLQHCAAGTPIDRPQVATKCVYSEAASCSPSVIRLLKCALGQLLCLGPQKVEDAFCTDLLPLEHDHPRWNVDTVSSTVPRCLLRQFCRPWVKAGTDQGCWLCTNRGATARHGCAVCRNSPKGSQDHVHNKQLVCHASIGAGRGSYGRLRASPPRDTCRSGQLIGNVKGALSPYCSTGTRWR